MQTLAQEAQGERALLPCHLVHLWEEGCAGLESREKPESGDGAEGALGLGIHESLVLLAEEYHVS